MTIKSDDIKENTPTHFYVNGVSYKTDNEEEKHDAYKYLGLWMKYLERKLPYDAKIIDHEYSELPPHFVGSLAQNPFLRLHIAIKYTGQAKMPLAYIINKNGTVDYE